MGPKWHSVKEMTLQEKIGQMVMCGFHGTEASEEILTAIRKYKIGGIIYFNRNVQDVTQTASLSRELQEAAKQEHLPPLWISMDQEGGMISRIIKGMTLLPGNMALAATGSPFSALDAGTICGRELLAVGINMNFAPVLDVNNNPDNPVIGVRSFGESPEIVGEYGVKYIQGLQGASVAATAKHFPGHGDTNVDSHLDLPIIRHERSRLFEVELPPFIKAIQANVDAIMTSHIYFPSIEPEALPATLSQRVLTGLLRQELQFEGLIITDCLEMDAIRKGYGTIDGAIKAIAAGADIVLISHTPQLQFDSIEAIHQAVTNGVISEQWIDRAVERILRYKKLRKLYDIEIEPGTYNSIVGSQNHLERAKVLSESGITLVKDDRELIPLQKEPVLVISVLADRLTAVDENVNQAYTLATALQGYHQKVEPLNILQSQITPQLQVLLETGKQYSQIIIVTYNAHFDTNQSNLVQQMIELSHRPGVIVVATRNPYDLKSFPNISTFLASYDNRPLALQSVAKILMGQTKAIGKLTVTI